MVYAYLRVSTDAQDTANQRLGVDTKAIKLGLNIDKYIIDDGVSGTIAKQYPNNNTLKVSATYHLPII